MLSVLSLIGRIKTGQEVTNLSYLSESLTLTHSGKVQSVYYINCCVFPLLNVTY